MDFRSAYLRCCNSIVPFVILHLVFSGIAADLGCLGWSAGECQRAERNPRKPCISHPASSLLHPRPITRLD